MVSIHALDHCRSDVLSPRPSHSLRTNDRKRGRRMVLQTTGTLEAGNRRESVQWQLGGGNSVRTRPSLGIGSKSSGGRGRRF